MRINKNSFGMPVSLRAGISFLASLSLSFSPLSAENGSAHHLHPQAADTVPPACYTHEADRFLQSLPAGLQQRQTAAVRKAMAGQTADLQAVRRSRNANAPSCLGVEMMQVAPNLRLYRPAGDARGLLPVLIYLHGGGWCFGSVNSCARFCSQLVQQSGIAVVAVDYPLAPEHPFPQPLEACVQAVRTVACHAAEWGLCADSISVGGDSAGGNLALGVALSLNATASAAKSGPTVGLRSLVLFYPVTEAWADSASEWTQYAEGYGLDAPLMEAFNEAYAGTHDVHDPLLSPACAPDTALATLPPVLVVNAGRDILCAQGRRFATRLMQLGVPVRREELPGAVHLFITVDGQQAAFRRAVVLTADMLRP